MFRLFSAVSFVLLPSFSSADCKTWCPNVASEWEEKCTWAGCDSCDECSPTTAPTITPATTPATTCTSVAECDGFIESWRDDFDSFDTQSWSRGLVYDQDPENIHMIWNKKTGSANLLNNKYCGWIRDEDSYVEDGNLYLRNTDTVVNGTTGEGDLTFNYTSGWINSMEKKYWNGAAKSSYLDIRAKFPYGPKNWPAIWMVENGVDGERSWPPEIDIWEYFGVFFNPSWGCTDCMYMRNIYGENYAVAESLSLIINDFITVEYPTADTEFHQYGWLWTDSAMVWYIDGSEVGRMDKDVDVSEEDWPDVNMCLIMNNGLLTSITESKYPELDETVFPNYVVIDSLVLYEEPDEDDSSADDTTSESSTSTASSSILAIGVVGGLAILGGGMFAYKKITAKKSEPLSNNADIITNNEL